MRVLIIGSGTTGRHLLSKLSEEHHDVVVIDHAPTALADTETQYDVMTIRGCGCSPAVLAQAEVEKAGLMVAVTGSDEVNVLACMYAKRAGVERTGALLRFCRPPFSHTKNPRPAEGFPQCIVQHWYRRGARWYGFPRLRPGSQRPRRSRVRMF